MVHITNNDLSKGIFDTLNTKDKAELKRKLVDVGTSIAVEFACDVVEKRTGLARSTCKPVAKLIVKRLRKRIRTKFAT